MEKMPTPDVPYGSYGSGPAAVDPQKTNGVAASGPPPPSYDKARFEYVKTGPVYQDFWATALYLVHFVGFLGLTGYGMSNLNFDSSSNSTNSNSSTSGSSNSTLTPEEQAAIMAQLAKELTYSLYGFLIGSVAAGILCGGYVYLMRRFPKTMIYIGFYFIIGMMLLGAVAVIAVGAWPAAIPLVLMAALMSLCFFCVRGRIALTAIIMETSISILNEYPVSYSLAAMNLVISFVFHCIWSLGVIGLSNNPSTEKLVYFMVFSLYWTDQILQNTLHVTIAGTVGMWYFMKPEEMPPNPTIGAAKRAISTSFGSIAYASLIIAIIQFMRYLARSASERGSIVGAIMACILKCIEDIAQYINSYALVHCAIYGSNFCDGAKKTFELLSTSGIQMVCNDSMIDNVIGLGGLAVGVLAGAVGIILPVALSVNVVFCILVFIGVMLMGFLMMGIVGMVVTSAAKTLFVCMAEEPSVLERTKPELMKKLMETYPQVGWRH